jgi:phage FluMu protein Com
MLSDVMICWACKRVIPPESFKLIRNGVSSEADDEIECPNCKVLNLVYLAKGRATLNPTSIEHNIKWKMVEEK